MRSDKVLGCIRAALARWAGSLGIQQAADEIGIDRGTLRRKRLGEVYWTDAELASAITHEIETTGTSAIIADLIGCEEAVPSLVERALRGRVLMLGAESSRLSSIIQTRLADENLSPRDAGEIRDAARSAMADLRTAIKALDAFVARAGGQR